MLPGAVKLLRRPELEQENSQGDIWCFGWQGDSESLYMDQNDSDIRFAEIFALSVSSLSCHSIQREQNLTQESSKALSGTV